jgi:hypothetical protein
VRGGSIDVHYAELGDVVDDASAGRDRWAATIRLTERGGELAAVVTQPAAASEALDPHRDHVIDWGCTSASPGRPPGEARGGFTCLT